MQYIGHVLLRILRIIAGLTCILLGMAGLFLPFLQGVLLLAIGIILLSEDIPPLRRLLNWFERRYPRFGRVLHKTRSFLFRSDRHPPPRIEPSRRSTAGGCARGDPAARASTAD